MKHLLVVYHSMTGATEQLARAAVAGAASEREIDARLMHAPDATSADVLAADGYVFATPENLASMAGLMKDFFDRIYYDALERVNGRPYAALIAAGTDGAGAARQLQRIATGLRLKEDRAADHRPQRRADTGSHSGFEDRARRRPGPGA